MRGPYGYYEVTRSYSKGNVHANNTGLFAQDGWTLSGQLTVSLGLRVENENVPSYRPENPGIHFGFRDKIAPRIGSRGSPRGNSQWKV